MGAIDSFVYTNSREAFERNYGRGFRLFEVDLRHTADGELVLAHDWYTPRRQPQSASRSLDSFESARVYGKYTPLSAAAAIELLRTHVDARLMLDVKETPARTLGELFRLAHTADSTVVPRLVPILYELPDVAAELNSRRFSTVVWSLHRTSASDDQILAGVERYGLRIVVTNKFKLDPQLLRALRRRGVTVYLSTVNAAGEESVLREWGATGVFTDILPPDSACSDPVDTSTRFVQ